MRSGSWKITALAEWFCCWPGVGSFDYPYPQAQKLLQNLLEGMPIGHGNEGIVVKHEGPLVNGRELPDKHLCEARDQFQARPCRCPPTYRLGRRARRLRYRVSGPGTGLAHG